MEAAKPKRAIQGEGLTLRDISLQIAALNKQVALLNDRQKQRDELFEEMQPVLKAVMETSIDKLQDLEDKGYFVFLREATRVADRIVQSYGEDDVRMLGDNIVRIMDTVRAMTQPRVMALASEAAEVLEGADELEPTGVMGMMRASRDEDVQLGMAVFLDLLRRIGRGVKELGKEERLAQRRPPALRRPAATQTPVAAKPKAQPKPTQPMVIDGVTFDAGGYLVDASQWTRELAEALATAQGIALTDRHWQALEAARKDYAETGQSPNVRRLSCCWR